MRSTLDADVAKIISNKDHTFVTFIAPGSEPNWEYCSRCGSKKDDLKINDGANYLPCKGFVG